MKATLVASAVFTALALTSGTNAFAQSELATEAQKELLVSGTIEQKFDTHTSQNPFVFKSESKAIVTIRSCVAPGGDAPCNRIHRHVVTGIHKFPIPFVVSSRATSECRREGITCTVDVEVRSNGGEKNEVDDLINEELIMLENIPTTGLQIQAGGLEKCGTPEAGGFCI